MSLVVSPLPSDGAHARWLGRVKGSYSARCEIRQRPLLSRKKNTSKSARSARSECDVDPLCDDEVVVLAAPRNLPHREQVAACIGSRRLTRRQMRGVAVYTVVPSIGCTREDSIFQSRQFKNASDTPIPNAVIMAAVGAMVAKL
jgi:hypothetical protein